jgi:hypothetical protein
VERIEALYCWIVVTETGDEGVMAIDYEGQQRPAHRPRYGYGSTVAPLGRKGAGRRAFVAAGPLRAARGSGSFGATPRDPLTDGLDGGEPGSIELLPRVRSARRASLRGSSGPRRSRHRAAGTAKKPRHLPAEGRGSDPFYAPAVHRLARLGRWRARPPRPARTASIAVAHRRAIFASAAAVRAGRAQRRQGAPLNSGVGRSTTH